MWPDCAKGLLYQQQERSAMASRAYETHLALKGVMAPNDFPENEALFFIVSFF